MQCKTVGQMRRVAHAGAVKMAASGKYTWNHAEFFGSPVVEIHKNDDDETMYRVDLTIGEAGWCSCPFHEANRHLAPEVCCKHTLYAAWMLEAEDVRAERELFHEIAQSGAGLGIPQVIGTVSAGAPVAAIVGPDSRIAKMFAHPADEIEAHAF